MEKKILMSAAAVLITLAAISTFVDFSQDITGQMVAPIAMNIHTVLTIFILVGIAVFMILRK